MSPRSSLVMALAGVVLAGLPLLTLTGRTPVEVEAGDAAPAVNEAVAVLLNVRYTGRPEELTLRHAGAELVRLQKPVEGEWEEEVMLPAAERWELEVEAEWPQEQAESAQAVTLTATPAAQAERADTHWTYAGEKALHGVFTLKGGNP